MSQMIYSVAFVFLIALSLSLSPTTCAAAAKTSGAADLQISLHSLAQPSQRIQWLQESFLHREGNAQGTADQILHLLKKYEILGHSQSWNDLKLEPYQAVSRANGLTLKFTPIYKSTKLSSNPVIATFGSNGQIQAITHDINSTALFEIDAAFSEREAVLNAKKSVLDTFKKWGVTAPPVIVDAELVIVKNRAGRHILAWRVDFGPLKVDIDASGEDQGKVINAFGTLVEVGHNAGVNIGQEVLINGFPLIVWQLLEASKPGQDHGTTILRNGQLTNEGQLLKWADSDFYQNQILVTSNLFDQVVQTFNLDFKLRSYDDKGASLKISFMTGMSGNAFWSGKNFGMGVDSGEIKGLSQAADVVAHEFTHAVVEHSSGLHYLKESGALNESLADIFGEYIQIKTSSKPIPDSLLWKIGETVSRQNFTTPLRDFREPKKGWQPQPEHMDELKSGAFESYNPKSCVPSPFNDNCGVHILSGITNKAFVTIVSYLGWDKAIQITYRVMSLRLHPTSDFYDFREHLWEECEWQFPSQCQGIRDAFDQVGVKAP